MDYVETEKNGGQQLEAYTGFAAVYDIFMDNVPYEEWGEYIHSLLKDRGIEDGILLDLGCGTGTMTEKLADYGYDMIGVDNSEDMLELAMEKRMESGKDILYLLQDMREFELYGTVRAIVSVCDSVNYITEPEELEEVFRLVTSIRGNSLENRISIESPLGKAIEGHHVGDQVEVKVNDKSSYVVEIRKIEKTGEEDSDRIRSY